MRLYSRSQVIPVIVLVAVVCTCLGVGLTFLWSALFNTKEPPSTSLSLVQDPHGGTSQAVDVQEDFNADEKENIAIYQNLNEAVVNISTEVLSYNWFLEAVPQSGGTGSGSIIDKQGFILTNNHVVAEAVKVTITLFDGSTFEGRIVGKDLENDLAVVKFDPKGRELKTVPLGTSKVLKVGQKVLAIGNPFALDRTMTKGIVSALGRPLRSENGLVLHQLIQTDASINPGNSGGPLLNSRGQMIGINTMIYSPTGGSVGIGFAVPVDTARRIVPDLMQYGKVIRGWVDMVPVQVFPQLVAYAHLKVSKGVMISKVTDGGQAQKAGLRGGSPDKAVRYGNTILYLGGDIITAINGIEIASLADLYSALEPTKPKDSITVTVNRDGQRKDFNVTLVERSDKNQWESE